MNQKKVNISIAYSPDSDDAFMIHALKSRNVDWENFEFSFVVGDIQELNDAAKQQRYDITAISVGAFPHLKNHYYLMTIGASVGEQFGPAIVTRPDSTFAVEDLKNKRIAVPGLTTTAHIAAQTVVGPFAAVPMHFTKIRDAVMNKEVDAGILIHELQMNPESAGLRRIGDLGKLWFGRFGLPLPLGANAVKRTLGRETIQSLSRIYRASIEVGLKNRQTTLNSAINSAVARDSLDLVSGDKYISMYVNDRSLTLNPDVIEAIQLIYQKGSEHGFFPDTNVVENLSCSV